MGSWTVVTNTEQDEAIAAAHQQSLKPPIGMIEPPPVTTIQEFFQARTISGTVLPMVAIHRTTKNTNLVVSLDSVPPENRAAAQHDIEAVIAQYGGAVPATTLTYQWSANTAAPPRNLSCELDATEANWATQISKLTFHHLDAGSTDRMATLMAVKLNTLIRLTDAANAANFVAVLTTGAPIQRQGSNGYVELPVKFSQKGGSFSALDTKPLTCTFA